MHYRPGVPSSLEWLLEQCSIGSSLGVRFAESDGPLLYVYSRDEQTAAEIEDDFSLLIADAASRILKREIEVVVVLPKVLQ